MIRATIVLPVMLVACGPSEPAAAGGEGMAARVTAHAEAPRWDAARCGKGDAPDAKLKRHLAFAGQSPEALLKAYGEASNDERFRVGGPAGVFYGALGKMPPGRAHPNAGRPARVLTWTKGGCELSVFFVQQDRGWAIPQAYETAAGADF